MFSCQTKATHGSGLHLTSRALTLIVVVSVVTALTACTSKPTVDELVSKYDANREHFRTIATLASVDATFGIDVGTGGLGGDNVDSKDLPGYARVLKALRAVGAEHLDASDHSLDVVTAREGLAASGSEAGYYYTTSSDVETVTLEAARSQDAPRLWYYPLGDGWYATNYRF